MLIGKGLTDGKLAEIPAGDAERRKWLFNRYEHVSSDVAERYRRQLVERYGRDKGVAARFAEAFEICEYGAPVRADADQLKRLFVGM